MFVLMIKVEEAGMINVLPRCSSMQLLYVYINDVVLLTTRSIYILVHL
jgi:hypothetical protein